MRVAVHFRLGRHVLRREVHRTETLALILILVVVLVVGLIRLAPKPMIPNASAVSTTANVGVYWDANFQGRVYSISWGTLTPGSTNKVEVYARNEGNKSFILALIPENWNPANVSQYLNFKWASDNISVGVGKAVKVTMMLSVVASSVRAPTSGGSVSFSFNIVFEGLDHFLGDLNRDGVVNMLDVLIACLAYGSHGPNYDYSGEPASPNWNPIPDLNNDNIVNILDVTLVTNEYGEHI
jgi:hypothetical protein